MLVWAASCAGAIAAVGCKLYGCQFLYTWPNGGAKIAPPPPQLDLLKKDYPLTHVWGRANAVPYSPTTTHGKPPKAGSGSVPHSSSSPLADSRSLSRLSRFLRRNPQNSRAERRWSFPLGWLGSEVGRLLCCGTARFGAELRDLPRLGIPLHDWSAS